ncbi:GIY-YIG nuclease family protein [Eubacterium limosum]|uniref:GIY-YIG nuclease family protein n=1 Tax=Eubacterium limosum TaxID=1736 RepID=A0ABT5UJ26_EUBLI|nr:GIY-YIG nuclease family protein [Eubacterium limosum]MCB6568556.1 GIY-YIG nuclease family protein [Eubacterium limosum]MDE1468898.1 GIY-YIG nuclease family protein [Eubacterium limosum]
MELPLNNIFHLSESEINNSRIELNMREGSGGIFYIDKWLSLEQSVKDSGITDCSYWGWYGNKKNFNVGQTVFSFIKMSYDEWLFISAAEIIDVPEASRAKVRIIEKYKPLFGRLVIRYYKGNTYARYVFRMDKIIDNCTVKEILPCQYNGEQFEGYDRVHLPFYKLSDVFHGKIMPTYYEALKKVTGIYCLTDTKTGKLYIGSATGGEGVAGRWGNYLDSKHGGNKKLIALYNDKGSRYFEDNFTYTLIEYFGLSYDPSRIIEREQYWKMCLNTIESGYNDN